MAGPAKWRLKMEQLMARNCSWGCACSFDSIHEGDGRGVIAFKFAGKRSAFRADGRVRVEFGPMRNPVTGEEHHFTGVLPTGLFTKREYFYSAKVFDVDAEPLSYRYPGRNAIASTSIWRGP